MTDQNRTAVRDGTEPKIGDRICVNCGQPLWDHCEVHFLPCCPGRCPGEKK
jgi:hypothetical protein